MGTPVLRRWILVWALAFGAVAAHAQSAPDPSAELRRSARLWEDSGRYDLARQALEKNRLTHPNDPQALLQIGLLDVRADRLKAAADVLAQMEARFAGSEATGHLQTAYRMATTDRIAMASVRRLMEIREGDQALAMLRELFPDGPPGYDLGLEYYRAVALTDRGWDRARKGFETLVAQDPENPRPRLALAQHLLDRPQSYAKGLKILTALASAQDVTTTAATEALRSALLERSLGLLPVSTLRDYVARHPDDEALSARLAQRQRLDRNRRFLAAPDLSAVPDPAMRDRISAHHRTLDRLLRELDPGEVPASAQRLFNAVVTGDAAQAWALAQNQRLPRDPDLRRHVQNLRESALGMHWQWRAVLYEGKSAWARADALLQAAVIGWDGRFYELDDPLQLLEREDPAEAESAYREALAIDASSATLMRALTAMLARQGRYDEALAAAAAFQGDRNAAAAIEAGVLGLRAQSSLEAGHTGPALEDLERAVRLAPDDPWLRYDLARLYRQLGLAERGRKLMDEGSARAPADPDGRYAQALYLSLIEDPQSALAALQAIPAEQRSDRVLEMIEDLRIPALLDQAQRLFASGEVERSEQVLAQAGRQAGSDPDALAEVARAWARRGQAERGYALMESAAAADGLPSGRSIAIRLALGQLYVEQAQSERLDALLATLPSPSALSAAQAEAVTELTLQADILAVESLQDDGRGRRGLERVEQALRRAPDNVRLHELRAELLLASGQPDAAVRAYAPLVEARPQDVDLRFGYVRALMDNGQTVAARAQLDLLERQIDPDDRGQRQLLFWRRYGIDDYDGAQRVINAQLQRYPDDADVLAAAAELARARGRGDDAVAYYRRAEARLRDTDDQGQLARAAALRESFERFGANHRGWFAAGVDLLHKPGTPGISKFDAVEVPVELRVGLNHRSHLFAVADRVDLSAGRLPADYDAAGAFGTVYATGPSAVSAFPNGYRVGDLGVALGVGYQSDTMRVDIGTTPLGFEVEDLVGGLELYYDVGPVDVTVDISRRPETSSVLSYAGIEDPVTGEVWGGVRATGVGVRAGRYEAEYSLSASAEHRWLSGRNVMDNQYTGLRLAGDHEVWAGDNWSLDAGLTLVYWRYDENLRYYSFGHGGYYSPQRRISVSLPLDLRGRNNRISYLLRGAVTYAASRERSMPVYPEHPDLQAAAALQLTPPGNFDSPFYDGGRSDGVGLSGRAAIEYALSRRWFIGAQAEIDRSDYYEPEAYGLYFRREFRPQRYPELPPRAPEPYPEY